MKTCGNRNVKTFTLPEINFPSTFEVFEPKISQESRIQRKHIVGTKTAEYVIIPRVSGKLELPEIRFSYFDPRREKYVTLKRGGLSIQVTPAQRVLAPSASGFSKEEIALLGQDIRFIKREVSFWRELDHYFPTFFFWGMLAFSVVLTGGSLILRKWVETLQTNQAFARRRKALKTARKHLHLAKKVSMLPAKALYQMRKN